MDIISCYTRAQAIEDGELVDVSDVAKEAGFCFPVALTRGVWSKCVEVPDDAPGQDEQGRLWDVLWMLRCRIARMKRTGDPTDRVRFRLYVRRNESATELVQLWSACGPGDVGEPVITVMLPGED